MSIIGKQDRIEKHYMKNKERFADLCNVILFQGDVVLEPEHIHELDTSSLAIVHQGEQRMLPVERLRDVLNSCNIGVTDDAAYVIVGVENQSEVHYAMTVKCMLYDVLKYVEQVEQIGTKNRAQKRCVNSAEFLSGLRKDDKLIPIVTIVVLWNDAGWDGARSLHDLLDFPDERLKQYVPDYRINLVAPSELTDEMFDLFRTNLGDALAFIKYSGNKTEMKSLMQNKIKNLDRETINLLNILTHTRIAYNEKEEAVDMCKAWDDQKQDGVEEAIRCLELMSQGVTTIADLAKAGISERVAERVLQYRTQMNN